MAAYRISNFSPTPRHPKKYVVGRKRPPMWPLILFLSVTGWVGWDYYDAVPVGQQARYMGRQSCAQCHTKEAQLWNGSDHDLAMDLATPDTVLGNFDNQVFANQGVTTRFERKKDKYYVTTEGPTGEQETFEIKYTFGVRPLQQYMVEFPDGRVQVLSIAWDTKDKKWFDLHPNERIKHDDWLHWTKMGANWNFMCADCHSTDLKKNYHPSTDTYETEFSEIDVSCEACHGPGSIHVQLANAHSLFWDRRYGYGLASLKGGSNKNQIDNCARCHSRRQNIFPNYHPGHKFLDHFEPELIANHLYHLDGQILEEDYEYGSFLQSRMYRENVRCSDCHDPHSTQLKFEGNKLCLQCHTPNKGNYDSPAHHHHQVDSAGASCVSCHMPTRTYMVVDPRRDHSIRVPRPDLTVKLGVPNACQQCHDKKHETPQWAADKVVEWYGPKRRDDPHYGEILAAGRQHDPDALPRLIKLAQQTGNKDQAKNVGDIVRASAISLLDGYPLTNESKQALTTALADPDPMVRTAAVKVLDFGRRLQEQDEEARWLHDTLMPLLSDPVREVRMEAARVLTQVPQTMLSTAEIAQLNVALDEWAKGVQNLLDDAGAYLALAMMYNNIGKYPLARQHYHKAINHRPNPMQAIQARVNLAMLEHLEGSNAETERLYREALELVKKNIVDLTTSLETAPEPEKLGLEHAITEQRNLLAGLHYSLGLLFEDSQARVSDAVDQFAEVLKLTPDDRRAQFAYGQAAQKIGKHKEAEAAFVALLRHDPGSIEYKFALAKLYMEQSRLDDAMPLARELSQKDPRYEALLKEVQRRKMFFGPTKPNSP